MSIEKLDFELIEKESVPFVVVSTFAIQNIKNAKAGFIWIYLHSLPVDWNVNKFQVMKHFDLSERDYQRHMSYLCKHNLIEYHRNRNPNGTLGAVVIIVLNGLKMKLDKDIDHTAKFGIVDEPLRQNTTPPKPTRVVSGTLTNTITTTKTNKKKKEENLPAAPVSLNPNYEYPETYFNPPVIEEPFTNDNPYSIPQELIQEWLSVRKRRKASTTERVWSSLNKQLGMCPNPVDAFSEMLDRGWLILKADWFKASKNKSSHFDNDNTAWIKDINKDMFR